MAEEIKDTAASEEVTASKNAKRTPKKPNIFVRAARAIKKFFRDLISEMKKVVWLSAKETRKQTIVVVVTVIAVSIVIGLVDFGFWKCIEGLSKLNLFT